MTRLTLRFSIILSVLCLFMACQKEYSLEKGGFSGAATGELVDSLGNCKSAQVKGTYKVDTPLNNSTNYVNINVNFTAPGKYKIYSDTVNGMWFIDSGFTVSTGAAVIKLKGYGTPILPKNSDFALIFNNNLCSFTIPVTGSGGTGGGGGGGTSTGTNGDYFPTTSGSNFVYQYVPKLGSVDTFSVNVAVGLATVDTLNYAKFGTSLLDTFYFAKDASRGIYYALSTVDFDYTYVFDSVPSFFITYPFLKENAAVATTWESIEYGTVKVGSQRGVAKAVFTVMAKNTSYTIGGKTYTNVINMKREIMFKAEGTTSFTTLLTGNSYYAKDYGLIDQVFPNTSPPQSVSLYQVPIIK
ncbi:MAG: hypothetical protein V4539_07760 [Bacteroidota bacterium]